MKRIIAVLGVVILLSGCKNYHNYDNKEHYIIAVDENVSIYYTTNSCCYPCVVNQIELKHLNLIDNKTISKESEECAGCNYIGELIFKGNSIGIDTIELKILSMNMRCDSNEIVADKYIVEIK